MTTDQSLLAIDTPATDTAARRQARRSLLANLTALEQTQPAVAAHLRSQSLPTLSPPNAPLEWVFARDGALTVRADPGLWWGGSSLPLRVGRSLMKSLDLQGAVGCLLAPRTAGQIRAALEHIAPSQAFVVIFPDSSAALLNLHCDDFAPEILAGRLWFLCGEDWDAQLANLLQTHPGLCVPQQYIRTGLLTDAEVSAMTARGNVALAGETERRAALATEIRTRSARHAKTGCICVVAGSNFSLWDIAGWALTDLLARNDRFRILDKDRPVSASPLALAMAANECDAIVTADLYRGDLPGIAPDSMPWITWVTNPHIAPPQPNASGDGLLLADPAWQTTAAMAGWPAARVALAGWPSLVEPTPIPANGPVVLIADAPAFPPPQRLQDFSSHRVLWEKIGDELSRNPLALGNDIAAYLASRMAELEIEGPLDQKLFREKLILPAWRRGVARRLLSAGLPLVLFGAGWTDADECARHAQGPVQTIDDLRRAARLAAGIVQPIPTDAAHPAFALARPVMRANSTGRGQFIYPPQAPPLSAEAIVGLLA
jgi:hypothetical protein